ncbi:tyrosine-type recombinase/integrase [Agrobacterium radiobacter]|uniref:Tyrosine-type recombinase/integrase n=1 Tax=Agrobacterium radiobacter TaxID=362 RepID=A0ABD5LGL4_AGRRD
MQRERLHDDLIGDLIPTERRYEIYDEKIPNLAIRIGARRKTFVLVNRFSANGKTVRRAIGAFPQTTTAEARLRAADWNVLQKIGVDPAVEQAAKKKAEALRLRSTFRLVVEDYIAYLPLRERNRSSDEDAAFIRANILNPTRNSWLDNPISEITDDNVASLVESLKARGVSTTAYKTLKMLRTIFNWAMLPSRRKMIGLQHNPIRDLTPRLMGLRKRSRTRVLDYREIRAFLAAAAATPPAYRHCFRALIETGQRIGEVSRMRWSYIDLEMKTWLIPGNTSKPEDDHTVPLSDAMISILVRLRTEQPYDQGDFVFSSSRGKYPLTNFSKKKNAFLEEFNASLPPGPRGEPPRRWTWHDVRRTVRTQLEPIVSRREVAEAAIGHSKAGMDRIYNHYAYRREVRKAFNAWSDLLKKIETGTLTIEDWEH